VLLSGSTRCDSSVDITGPSFCPLIQTVVAKEVSIRRKSVSVIVGGHGQSVALFAVLLTIWDSDGAENLMASMKAS
jgi:hypothetical protein